MDETDVGIYEVVFDRDSSERPPWQILGCQVSRSLLLFVIQIIGTLFVLTVCMIQIYQGVNPTVYLCIISACIGYLLPAPSLTSSFPTITAK